MAYQAPKVRKVVGGGDGSMFGHLQQYIDQNKTGTQALGQKVTGLIGGSINEANRQLTPTQPQTPNQPAQATGLGARQTKQAAPVQDGPTVGGFAQRPFTPPQQNFTAQVNAVAPKPQMQAAPAPTAVDKFNQQVSANPVQFDQRLIEEMQTDPVAFAKDPAKVAKLQAMLNAQYGGPQSLEESPVFGELQKAISGAKDNAALTQDFNGQTQLAQKFATMKDTNAGRNAFDAMLLGGDQGVATSLRNTAAGAGQLDAKLKTASEGAKAKVSEAQKAAEGVRNKAAGAGKEVTDAFAREMAGKLAKAKLDAGSVNQSVKQALASGQPLNDAQLKAIGLSKEQYGKLQQEMALDQAQSGKSLADTGQGYKTPGFEQFLTMSDPESIDMGSVATDDDRARQAALQSIMGGSAAPIGEASGLGGPSFDYEKALQAIQTGRSDEKARQENSRTNRQRELQTQFAQAKAEAEAATAQKNAEIERQQNEWLARNGRGPGASSGSYNFNEELMKRIRAGK